MIHLEIGGERYAIAAGETVIGSAAENAVVLSGTGVYPRHAVVRGTPGAAAIRPATPDAEVLVNGVRVGPEPTPLLHGDKISIAAHELLVADSTRAGSTQLFDSGAFTDLVPPPAPVRPAGRTGGRVVCLTDGREYQVGDGPLSFGREAGADVVVSGPDVSRQHAEIRTDADGYLLVDTSVNGTYVNGDRVVRSRRLSRADVIRIGHDEFRFYADAAAAPAPAALRSEPKPAEPPTGASERLSNTMHGLPVSELQREVTPAAPAPAPLASLLFRTGDLRGRRVPIKVPVVNIGRGDYNDILISDPSVSTMHAKLQRREAVWVLTDLGSTNGTFVEGERLTGEQPLTPGTTIRFGDVSALFEPLDDDVPATTAGGTRVMDRVDPAPAPARAVSSVPGPVPSPAPGAASSAPRSRRPIHVAPPRPRMPSTIMVVGLVILVAILAYLLSS
jgi:pSer/pThr/pTyr-binding forkhead associated (FHA) protein